MPVLTKRLNSTVQLGTWTVVGAGGVGHAALSDESDATYVQNINRCELDNQVAIFGIEDIDIPDGAKIFSVRTRVRVEKVTPPFGIPSPICLIFFVKKIIIAALTVNVPKLLRIIFWFRCPKPAPTVTWETQTLGYYLEDPEGKEWTEDSFNDFEVRLGRSNSGANLKVSAVYVDLDYNTRPTVSVTGPATTITGTTRPEITWAYSDAEGDPQQAWRVKIFTAEQYGAGGFDPETTAAFTESGWVNGSDLTWTANRDLPNGTYRAYTMVEQVWSGLGQHRSTWTSIQWTQNVPGPPNPILDAIYEPDLNRVRINLTKGGISPPTDTYNIEYSDNLGVTWAFLRNGVQVAPDGTGVATVYDYEAPLNRVRQYRSQGYRILGTIKVSSDFSNIAEATPRSHDWWLKDPAVPALNTTLPVATDAPARPRNLGEFAPLVAEGAEGRKIVVAGPRFGVEGTLGLIFARGDSADDGPGSRWAKFNSLQVTGRVLLLQYPTGEQHYIALRADLTWVWDIRGTDVYYRRASIGYVEVEAPPVVVA